MTTRSDQSAPPKRLLRLSTLLTQLKEDAVVDPATVVPAPADDPATAAAKPPEAAANPPAAAADLPGSNATAARPRRRWRRRRLRPLSNITIGEILDRTRQASFGFAAALVALISIPFFGLSTPFGLAIALTGAQLALGHDRPWLPKRVREHRVSMKTIDWLGRFVARWTAGLEHVIRPRFAFMSEGAFRRLCGLGIVLQGVGLALPLPIPGSNALFIVPILMYGIALLEADGLLIMVCHTITVAEAASAVWFWKIVSHAAYTAFVHVAPWVGL
jgi:hypothetical protein